MKTNLPCRKPLKIVRPLDRVPVERYSDAGSEFRREKERITLSVKCGGGRRIIRKRIMGD